MLYVFIYLTGVMTGMAILAFVSDFKSSFRWFALSAFCFSIGAIVNAF